MGSYAIGVLAGAWGRRQEEEAPEPALVSLPLFLRRVQQRNDIFTKNKDHALSRIECACLLTAILVGVLLSNAKVSAVIPLDYIEPGIAKRPERDIELVGPVDVPRPEPATEVQRPEEPSRKTIKRRNPVRGESGRSGGGDPRARTAKIGLLGILSGAIKGKTAQAGDIFGKGGYADNIDAILNGLGGLSKGGGGVGRKGQQGIGHGKGYGPSGYGDGGGGDLDIGFNAEADFIELEKIDMGNIPPQHSQVRIKNLHGDFITDGRSRAEIMRVVMQNLVALRYAYSRRLRENPSLKGKITVLFAIDEFGKVIHCEVVESSMGDATLEQEIASKIKKWRFRAIDKPGDVTEIRYPFVFTS